MAKQSDSLLHRLRLNGGLWIHFCSAKPTRKVWISFRSVSAHPTHYNYQQIRQWAAIQGAINHQKRQQAEWQYVQITKEDNHIKDFCVIESHYTWFLQNIPMIDSNWVTLWSDNPSMKGQLLLNTLYTLNTHKSVYPAINYMVNFLVLLNVLKPFSLYILNAQLRGR